MSASELIERVFCAVCGAKRVQAGLNGKHYVVCPDGHGRLWRKFTAAEAKEAREAIALQLPEAVRRGRTFTLTGRSGLFEYHNRDGLCRVDPRQKVAADQVVARHETRAGRRIRVFTMCEAPT